MIITLDFTLFPQPEIPGFPFSIFYSSSSVFVVVVVVVVVVLGFILFLGCAGL